MSNQEILYRVVINTEEQYSIWPIFKEIPTGWRAEGKDGAKSECLDYIEEVWTDMRPLSLRKWLKEQDNAKFERDPRIVFESSPSSQNMHSPTVNRLLKGTQSINLNTITDLDDLIESIKRKYVFVTFTGTQGGTTLGLQLKKDTCRWEKRGFPKNIKKVEIYGTVSLDSCPLVIKAEIDLKSFTGHAEVNVVST